MNMHIDEIAHLILSKIYWTKPNRTEPNLVSKITYDVDDVVDYYKDFVDKLWLDINWPAIN